jgi:hypothetical protein
VFSPARHCMSPATSPWSRSSTLTLHASIQSPMPGSSERPLSNTPTSSTLSRAQMTLLLSASPPSAVVGRNLRSLSTNVAQTMLLHRPSIGREREAVRCERRGTMPHGCDDGRRGIRPAPHVGLAHVSSSDDTTAPGDHQDVTEEGGGRKVGQCRGGRSQDTVTQTVTHAGLLPRHSSHRSCTS